MGRSEPTNLKKEFKTLLKEFNSRFLPLLRYFFKELNKNVLEIERRHSDSLITELLENNLALDSINYDQPKISKIRNKPRKKVIKEIAELDPKYHPAVLVLLQILVHQEDLERKSTVYTLLECIIILLSNEQIVDEQDTTPSTNRVYLVCPVDRIEYKEGTREHYVSLCKQKKINSKQMTLKRFLKLHSRIN